MIVGLCQQCAAVYSSTRFYNDFQYLPESKRSVYCYGCGPIKVNAVGYCVSDCTVRHLTPFKRFINWLKDAALYGSQGS